MLVDLPAFQTAVRGISRIACAFAIGTIIEG